MSENHRDRIPSSANHIPPSANHGWRVTFAGLGINLALAIMYTWSVISKGVPDSWGWSQADKSLPYAVSCLVICLAMVPAGHMQDKLGPRLVATIGGILVGLGMILASFTTTSLGYVLGFGVLTGAGIAFAYASATPPAVKWFPAAKTGTIVGIVVSGFGLAPVYAAPLANWLIGNFGLATAVMVLGVAVSAGRVGTGADSQGATARIRSAGYAAATGRRCPEEGRLRSRTNAQNVAILRVVVYVRLCARAPG